MAGPPAVLLKTFCSSTEITSLKEWQRNTDLSKKKLYAE